MQLREARLCLDCEELHAHDRCPICASEAFAFLTRWVPESDHSPRRRPTAAPRPEPPLPVAPPRSRWVKRGLTSAAGVTAFALTRWLLRPSEKSSDDGPAKE